MNGREGAGPGAAAPAEERSCSWLNPWGFLVAALAIKTAFVTVCLVVFLRGSQGPSQTLLWNGTEWSCVPSAAAGRSGWCWQPPAKRGSLVTPAGGTASLQEEGWMCCPKGWRCFQDKCYYLPPDTMSWGDSEKNCTGMGSHLVVVNSKAEQEFLFTLGREAATDAYETKYYLGLAADERGRWRWVDRSPYVAAEAFWKPGEPNLLFAEKCAAIHIKGHTDSNTYYNWNNILCFTSCYRICELGAKFV